MEITKDKKKKFDRVDEYGRSENYKRWNNRETAQYIATKNYESESRVGDKVEKRDEYKRKGNDDIVSIRYDKSKTTREYQRKCKKEFFNPPSPGTKKMVKDKKTKKKNIESEINEEIGIISLEEFKALSDHEKVEIIKVYPKEKIKDFYKEIYLRNLISHFQRLDNENPDFLSEYSLPFRKNKREEIVLKKGQYMKLFENPKFLPLCRKLKIGVLDGEKYDKKKSSTEKIFSTLKKTQLHNEDNVNRIQRNFSGSHFGYFQNYGMRQQSLPSQWNSFN